MHFNRADRHTRVPGILEGRSTGRRLWAACCPTQLHKQLEQGEQGQGHDAGKPQSYQQGVSVGTQKPFPDRSSPPWSATFLKCPPPTHQLLHKTFYTFHTRILGGLSTCRSLCKYTVHSVGLFMTNKCCCASYTFQAYCGL